MRRTALLLLLCAAAAAPSAGSTRARTIPRPPVVVELFTAQGCTACGGANAFVTELADRDGVVALTWPVDYWDYLGWKDTFAKPEFTERQRAYDRRLGIRDVYTPQVVVDGALQVSGAKSEAVETLIREASRAPVNPPDMLVMANGRVAVGSGRAPRGGAEVWLVRYDPRKQDIEVTGGDNRGKTVPHRNVVRELIRLGAWTGRPAIYRARALASDDGLESLILVQAKGGKVIGAMKATPRKI